MVKTGHSSIRRVRFLPPEPGVGDIEVNTLRGIRDRGGPHEFLTPQRLDFDLLFTSRAARRGTPSTSPTTRCAPATSCGCEPARSTSGERSPTSRAPSSMFGPHTVDDRTSDLIRSQLVRQRSHWPAADLDGHARLAGARLADVPAAPTHGETERELRQAALAHCLAALLVQLALVEPAGNARRHRDRPTRRSAGSATTSRSTSGAGTRSASTPTGWATRPAPSTASPGRTPASPPRSSSTSASCWRPSGS